MIGQKYASSYLSLVIQPVKRLDIMKTINRLFAGELGDLRMGQELTPHQFAEILTFREDLDFEKVSEVGDKKSGIVQGYEASNTSIKFPFYVRFDALVSNPVATIGA